MIEVTNGASTTSRRPGRMLTNLAAWHASEMSVQLSDRRWYRDWQAGLAGPLFGYAPKWWVEAVKMAAQCYGSITSIRHASEQIVAERLGWFYPDIESVRFMLNGSDPCAAAVKLARAVTGRDKLLVYGYHGTSSAYAAPPAGYDPDDNRLGTLQSERDAYVPLDWLGEYPLDFQEAGIAAVIVECPPVDGGKEEAGRWLRALAQNAHKGDALFVLDEVVTGFRYCTGGAAQYYQLQGLVDLYCFGKTLGNGYPVAALAGRRDVMQWLAEKPGGGGRVHWSNTFNACPISLAAAGATLLQLNDAPPWEHLYKIGGYLKEQWNALDLPYRLAGHPTRPIIEGVDERFDDLRRHLFRRGHIVVDHPWYVSTATQRSDVDALVEAVGEWGQWITV